jgi:hypothetical protein
MSTLRSLGLYDDAAFFRDSLLIRRPSAAAGHNFPVTFLRSSAIFGSFETTRERASCRNTESLTPIQAGRYAPPAVILLYIGWCTCREDGAYQCLEGPRTAL